MINCICLVNLSRSDVILKCVETLGKIKSRSLTNKLRYFQTLPRFHYSLIMIETYKLEKTSHSSQSSNVDVAKQFPGSRCSRWMIMPQMLLVAIHYFTWACLVSSFILCWASACCSCRCLRWLSTDAIVLAASCVSSIIGMT